MSTNVSRLNDSMRHKNNRNIDKNKKIRKLKEERKNSTTPLNSD